MEPTLEIVPLGGLGEVGMNCMTLTCGGDMVVLDCGVTFPGGYLGVNIVHPQFGHIDQHRNRLRAVLITHGHEDHIGALPFLARLLGDDMPPVYAPPYAQALIEQRFTEFEGLRLPELRPLSRGQSVGVGCFEVEPYRVNHSIPDSYGLILRTPAGVVVHSGDFKIEDSPPDGEPFDEERLQKLGNDGVALLLSDSTNVDTAGTAGNERDAADALSALVAEATGRVIIAQFASNIYRMRGALEAARKSHRKVLLLGRSVVRHAEVARSLGHIRGFDDRIVSHETARKLPPKDLLVIATGTQGEAAAALSRLARDEHRFLSVHAGDTVILSARIIPGLEKTVYAMIDALERKGLTVIRRRTHPGVHVSGHACRDEQAQLIKLLRPAAFVPVHGTFHMLTKHAALADELGVKETLVVENGTPARLQDQKVSAGKPIKTGRVHIGRGEEIDGRMLKDRELASELGIAMVAIALRAGRVVGYPEVETRGFLQKGAEAKLCERASQYIRDDLRKARDLEPEHAERLARRSLKRFFGRVLRRKPIVVALAIEVD